MRNPGFSSVQRSRDGIGQAPNAILQFDNPHYDLRGRRLRPDVGIEFDLAFDLLNVFAASGFAIVDLMDGSRKDARQWIAIRHGTEYKSETRRVESLTVRVTKRALPPIRAYTSTVQDIKLIVIQECGSRVEADLAKCTLEDADIEAMIQADTAGGMREHLAWSGAGFKILVREEDATVARELLNTPAKGDENADADFETDADAQAPWRRFT